MPFSPSSKSRLTTHDLDRFAGNTLFDRIARAVCEAGCLPRKELYEAWEVARRVRRVCRGGRVVDMAGGHGLLAHVMLLLDDSSADAIVIDREIPASARTLSEELCGTWPRLRGRVAYVTDDLARVTLSPDAIVVSCHACGALTDAVLEAAARAHAAVAVLPCCHDRLTSDPGPLSGWMDPALAIDTMRALALQQRGYHVRTQTIPSAITPKNRLLIGVPQSNTEAG